MSLVESPTPCRRPRSSAAASSALRPACCRCTASQAAPGRRGARRRRLRRPALEQGVPDGARWCASCSSRRGSCRGRASASCSRRRRERVAAVLARAAAQRGLDADAGRPRAARRASRRSCRRPCSSTDELVGRSALTSILDHLVLGVILLDDRGRVTYANRSAAELLGVEPGLSEPGRERRPRPAHRGALPHGATRGRGGAQPLPSPRGRPAAPGDGDRAQLARPARRRGAELRARHLHRRPEAEQRRSDPEPGRGLRLHARARRSSPGCWSAT